MLNYEVDAAVLAAYVPAGLEIDYWRGRTYVSLVGFIFGNTRLRGAPIPFHRTFEEVNLRFYVRRGDRRGVVFIREIVPRRAIAWVARLVYGEHYVRLPMRSEFTPSAAAYGWKHGGKWSRIVVSRFGPRIRPAAGSHEEFIAEHHWGYTRRTDGSTLEYRVEHDPWSIQPSAAAYLEGSVAGLYPSEFEFLDTRAPNTAFLADGSFVAVFPGAETVVLSGLYCSLGKIP